MPSARRPSRGSRPLASRGRSACGCPPGHRQGRQKASAVLAGPRAAAQRAGRRLDRRGMPAWMSWPAKCSSRWGWHRRSRPQTTPASAYCARTGESGLREELARPAASSRKHVLRGAQAVAVRRAGAEIAIQRIEAREPGQAFEGQRPCGRGVGNGWSRPAAGCARGGGQRVGLAALAGLAGLEVFGVGCRCGRTLCPRKSAETSCARPGRGKFEGSGWRVAAPRRGHNQVQRGAELVPDDAHVGPQPPSKLTLSIRRARLRSGWDRLVRWTSGRSGRCASG